MRKIIYALAAIAAIGGWTKYVWQTGFDQGADVSGCVIASLENDGKFATDSGFCKSAKRGESNPLWLLRRRDGATLKDTPAS